MQLVYQFKGILFVFLDFFNFFYMYTGVGDSSGNVIPEEWAASLPI